MKYTDKDLRDLATRYMEAEESRRKALVTHEWSDAREAAELMYAIVKEAFVKGFFIDDVFAEIRRIGG